MSEQREQYIIGQITDLGEKPRDINLGEYLKRDIGNQYRPGKEATLTQILQDYEQNFIRIELPKNHYLAILNLIDVCREATKPPYADSDPASLLETIQTRLREALDLIQNTSP